MVGGFNGDDDGHAEKIWFFSPFIAYIYMYFFYLVLLLLMCICMLLYQNRLWIQSNLVRATIVSDVSWPITRRKLWAILPP